MDMTEELDTAVYLRTLLYVGVTCRSDVSLITELSVTMPVLALEDYIVECIGALQGLKLCHCLTCRCTW